jgi:hypothetical protein
MAWPMHLTHRHQSDTLMDPYRWERPPQVEEGQTARVHAPRATALLEGRATPPAAGPPLDATA